MNRFLLSLAGTLLLLGYGAQQTPTGDAGQTKRIANKSDLALPSVDEQLKIFTEKLDLTSEQQKKVKPIMQELHDATEKLALDQKLTYDERLAKIRPHRMEADKKLRAVLTDEQQKKLDAYEAGPHGEMHGNLTGKPN